MTLVTLLLACNPDPVAKVPSGTTTTPTGDTPGPDLPACTAQTGSSGRVGLSGVVLTPEGPVAGLVVYDATQGEILCVGDCDTTDVTVVCTEGVISPGLIDLHNHLQYNTLPPWQVEPEFDDRYEWREDDRYWDYRTAYDAISDSYDCEIMKWAELRELVHGTTSAVGSSGGDCIHLLVRNLDEDTDAHGLSSYALDYSSSTVTDSLDDSDGDYFAGSLSDGSLDAVLNHVAEGRGGSVRSEIDWMFEVGMSGPGMVWVHTSDATTEQLARMAVEGTGILWSPRSNLALYATTTPVDIATKLGVPWAIGTDWTPSGTMAPSREIACAEAWLAGKGAPLDDVALWQKVTSDAARIANLDGLVGSLEIGLQADIAVFTWDRYPYRQVIGAGAEDVRLALVGGEALYGTSELVSALAANPSWCETIDSCGEARQVCLKAAESGDDALTLAELESTLTAALAATSMPSGYEYGGELYPLFACVDEPEVCSLAAPTDTDADGDGVATGDLCPDHYDPDQWDTDGDGAGDTCDDCPLTVGACSPSSLDVDGDGVANDEDNCPYFGNADQADGDADAAGDVCDACPEAAGLCSRSVADLRNPDSPDRLPEGTEVVVEGLVVTAIRAGSGFFVQDPTLSEWAGILVYDGGANSVALGDVVTVEGTYTEYYDQSELTDPTVTVTGSGAVPAPIPAAACDVATGGADAERYESMLVTVGAVSVSNENPDAPDDYDEFEVEGCLRVDDYLWEDLDQPAADTTYTALTGVVVFSYGEHKLAPRDAQDLQEG